MTAKIRFGRKREENTHSRLELAQLQLYNNAALQWQVVVDLAAYCLGGRYLCAWMVRILCPMMIINSSLHLLSCSLARSATYLLSS